MRQVSHSNPLLGKPVVRIRSHTEHQAGVQKLRTLRRCGSAAAEGLDTTIRELDDDGP